MENFYPTVFNLLHDGLIIAVEKMAPEAFCLHVSIDYLRKRFTEPGDSVQVLLIGCTRLAYQASAEGPFITDLSAIAAQEPEILSASVSDGLCKVDCSDGVLEVIASDGALRLNNEHDMDLCRLMEASGIYWAEFRERARKAQKNRK